MRGERLTADTAGLYLDYNGGRKLALAAIHRDLEGLRAEVEFKRTIAARG